MVTKQHAPPQPASSRPSGRSRVNATLCPSGDQKRTSVFVEGPPGSGKTWTGARLIVHLLRKRLRVGVAAPSHRAIHNLLAEIEGVAPRGRRPLPRAQEVRRRGRDELHGRPPH